ncbi:MAG: hypothetical protein ACRCZF_18820, partial [Gemmataceae bacterium]
MSAIPHGHPLQRMFAGLTEYTFQTQLGLADPPLVDYLSELLSRFLHTDEIHRLRGQLGQPLAELATMSNEADALPEGGATQREYYR